MSIGRPLRVVHSALCTRVVLNLRKAAAGSASGMSVSLARYADQATLVFNTGSGSSSGDSGDGAADDLESDRSCADMDMEGDTERGILLLA